MLSAAMRSGPRYLLAADEQASALGATAPSILDVTLPGIKRLGAIAPLKASDRGVKAATPSGGGMFF